MPKNKPTIKEALAQVTEKKAQAAAKAELLKAAAAFVRAKRSKDVELKKQATLDLTAVIVKQARFGGGAIMRAGKKALKGAKKVGKKATKAVKGFAKKRPVGTAAGVGGLSGAVAGANMADKKAHIEKLAAILAG